MSIRYKSTGHLVQAVKIARTNPDAQFTVPGDFPLSSAEVIANFRKGVMARCNRGLVIADDKSFIDMQWDARIINDAAKRIRWSGCNLLRTPALIARYPQIHNPPFD